MRAAPQEGVCSRGTAGGRPRAGRTAVERFPHRTNDDAAGSPLRRRRAVRGATQWNSGSRIMPSCTVVAIMVPSRVNIFPMDSPRAEDALGEVWV